MFSSQEEDNSKYDGLLLKIKGVGHSSTPSSFYHKDISAEEKPDIFSGANFIGDKQNDWVLLEEESYAVCEEPGRCELSVAFVRNFDTFDHENDIPLQMGEELEYNLIGYYKAKDSKTGRISHIGQS